jgi:hypothetical protein
VWPKNNYNEQQSERVSVFSFCNKIKICLSLYVLGETLSVLRVKFLFFKHKGHKGMHKGHKGRKGRKGVIIKILLIIYALVLLLKGIHFL